MAPAGFWKSEASSCLPDRPAGKQSVQPSTVLCLVMQCPSKNSLLRMVSPMDHACRMTQAWAGCPMAAPERASSQVRHWHMICQTQVLDRRRIHLVNAAAKKQELHWPQAVIQRTHHHCTCLSSGRACCTPQPVLQILSDAFFFYVQHHASGRAARMAPMGISMGAPSPSPQQKLLP